MNGKMQATLTFLLWHFFSILDVAQIVVHKMFNLPRGNITYVNVKVAFECKPFIHLHTSFHFSADRLIRKKKVKMLTRPETPITSICKVKGIMVVTGLTLILPAHNYVCDFMVIILSGLSNQWWKMKLGWMHTY